ncbi:MAG: ribosomal protein S18-alanine N-acetyltransferase [Desulfobacterales bacterium]
MRWHLFALTESDIEQILLIEKISFKQPWSFKLFHEELSSKDAFDYVVKLNGTDKPEEVIAYICSRITGSEMSILRIAVVPKCRNSGIAFWLLNRCFEKALTKGVTSVFLEVRESNDAATALYSKLGFMPVGIRPNYYTETGEDALVFMKKLS